MGGNHFKIIERIGQEENGCPGIPQSIHWMNREQIKELFDANIFVETLEYFFTEVDKERR